MKKLTMPHDAIETLKQAYLYREDGFRSERFTELYLDWCKQTGYNDLDGENFRVYVKVYGEPPRPKTASLASATGDARGRVTNRMGPGIRKTDANDWKTPCSTMLVETHRREMIRRQLNATNKAA